MHYVFILFKFIFYASLKKKKKKRKKKGGAEISHTIKKKMKREKISKRRSTANLDTNYNWPGFFIHSTLISLRPFCVLSINPNSFPPNPHSKIDLQQRLICTGQCNGGLQMSKGICFNFSYFVFSDRFFFFFLRFWIGSNSEIWNLSRSISAAQIVVFPIFISMSEFRSSIPIFHSKKWKARNNFFTLGFTL